MLHIRGNSVTVNQASTIKTIKKSKPLLRISSNDSISSVTQQREILKIDPQVIGSQSSLPSKLKKLSHDFYLRSSKSSRFSKGLSMKTQLIQFNSKVLDSRKNILHSRSNSRLGQMSSDKKISKKPKENLEIFVYSKKYPKVHMNFF